MNNHYEYKQYMTYKKDRINELKKEQEQKLKEDEIIYEKARWTTIGRMAKDIDNIDQENKDEQQQDQQQDTQPDQQDK